MYRIVPSVWHKCMVVAKKVCVNKKQNFPLTLLSVLVSLLKGFLFTATMFEIVQRNSNSVLMQRWLTGTHWAASRQ